MGSETSIRLWMAPSFKDPWNIVVTLPPASGTQGTITVGSDWMGSQRTPISAELSAEQAERIASLVRRLGGDFPASEMIGFDGTSYGLTVQSPTRTLELEWWQRVPAEWTGVSSLTRELIRIAEQHLGDKIGR